MNQRKHLKFLLGDYLIALAIVALALGIWAATFLAMGEDSQAKYISIQVDGKEIERIPWEERLEAGERHIEGIGGANVVAFEEDGVHMLASDCRDQICVHTAPVHLPGEMIVCLPQRVIVEVKAEESSPDTDLMLR
ncbi:MAG: NusG domain II-containing protein [Tissierellia bacterium]|nr:NusG domain II-containing protein [Tissierellia bacterium]